VLADGRSAASGRTMRGPVLVEIDSGPKESEPFIVVRLLSPGRPSPPQLRQHVGQRGEHLAGSLPGGHALRVGLPGRQLSPPSRPAARAPKPVQQSLALRVLRRPASNAFCHPGALVFRARSPCGRARVPPGRRRNSWPVEPRIFFTSATSSGPKCRAVRLGGVILVGAGKPMIVRSTMKLGRDVSAFAAAIASRLR